MKRFKNWVPAMIIMSVIFIMSELSGTFIQNTGLGNETLHINGHFILFFLLCIAYYKAVKSVPVAVLLSMIYAVADEFHQMYTLLRSPSVFDIKIDIIGAVAAGILLWKFQYLLPKNLKDWLNN